MIGAALAIVLFTLGVAVRVIDLQNNPPGMWQDEASTGIDAYLIWTTGRDRAGDFLPIISRSFGDYPLAGYRYLTAPIVGVFGLSIATERAVAAASGVLLMLVTALFAMRVFGWKVALLALLSAAMCPTWIHFSRYGSEAILLPLALMLGTLLVEYGSDEEWTGRRWPIWLGALALASSAYTYHAVKLVLPLWMLGFLVYRWPLIRRLWTTQQRRHVFGPALLFALAVLPSIIAAFSAGGMARGQTVLAFYHFDGWKLVRVILNNYLTYFDLGMLFVRGGPAVAQSIPGLGLWNMIELPFVLAGLYVIARGEHPTRRVLGFFAFWFVLGPLPGGVTYESHNIGRVIGWLPAPQLISAIGMAHALDWAFVRRAGGYGGSRPLAGRLRPARVVVVALAGLAWVATIAQVLYLTLVSYPVSTERDWQFEISRAMICAREKRTTETIIVSPQFQAADAFARFHFAHLPKKPDGTESWLFGHRATVGENELYVTPADGLTVNGDPICTITLAATGEQRAFVYTARPVVPKPIAPNVGIRIGPQLEAAPRVEVAPKGTAKDVQ